MGSNSILHLLHKLKMQAHSLLSVDHVHERINQLLAAVGVHGDSDPLTLTLQACPCYCITRYWSTTSSITASSPTTKLSVSSQRSVQHLVVVVGKRFQGPTSVQWTVGDLAHRGLYPHPCPQHGFVTALLHHSIWLQGATDCIDIHPAFSHKALDNLR